MGYCIVNQRSETVLTMTILHILKKRP